MEILPVFADFLAVENYSDNIDMTKLKTEIYHYASKDEEGNSISNFGGYQSKAMNFQVIVDYYPEMKKMLDLITFSVNELVNKDDYLAISNAWININKSGDYNTHHAHPISVISGSFYVSIPEEVKDAEAKIEFRRSREFDDYNMTNHLSDMDDIFKWSQMWYRPKNGDVVLFPSYLTHGVSPHFTNEDRISIAFNTMVKGKNK